MKRENQLLENKQMREEVVGRIEVLEQVGELLLLPNTEFATTEMVAKYYDVGIDTIKKITSRNKQELLKNGYKVLKEDELRNIKLKCGLKTNVRSLAIFPKRAILTTGLLLRDSIIADEIKQRLGLSINSNLFLRREMKFKKELDIAIENIRKNIRYDHFFNEDYEGKEISDLHKTINKAINCITTYETQYPCCNGKYRVDFYFPKLNIVIEYDEKYHERQKEKDKQREYEIMKDIYIGKYYKQYSDEEIKEWEYESREEMFDAEYEEKLLDYSFDMTRFARIKEGNEIEGLMYACSMIAITASSIIDSRGMSCKYDDLIA